MFLDDNIIEFVFKRFLAYFFYRYLTPTEYLMSVNSFIVIQFQLTAINQSYLTFF